MQGLKIKAWWKVTNAYNFFPHGDSHHHWYKELITDALIFIFQSEDTVVQVMKVDKEKKVEEARLAIEGRKEEREVSVVFNASSWQKCS